MLGSMSQRVLNVPAPPANGRVNYGWTPSQFMDVRFARARRPRPLVIMIHGGYWRVQYDLLHAGHLCAALTDHGFVTANLEYRRVGEGGGGWPGTFEDIREGIRFARSQEGKWAADPRRAVVIGHSAGGQLALWAAAEIPELTAVIALAPVASLRKAWELHLSNDAVVGLMHGAPDQKPEDYAKACPAQRPAANPRYLLHGAKDDVVPLELSREYLQSRKGDPGGVKLEVLPNMDHFDLIDPDSEAFSNILHVLQMIDR
jgi:acetyl esterase/lipase